MTQFGTNYFGDVRHYGVGIGINPSDARPLYFEDNKCLDFVELTASSSRLSGRASYAQIRMRNRSLQGEATPTPEAIIDSRSVLVHSTNLNPVYPVPGPAEDFQTLADLINQTRTPWVTEDLGVWFLGDRHTYPHFMQFPFTERSLAVTIENVDRIQRELGVPFNAEFPPISQVVGDWHPFDFFRVLAEETGCGMCLDLGHVLSFQLESSESVLSNLHLLPWSQITELHVAGGQVLKPDGMPHYDDSHGDFDVVDDALVLLDAVLSAAPNVRAITYEAFGATQPSSILQRIEEIRLRPLVQEWLAGISCPGRAAPPLRLSAADRAQYAIELSELYDSMHNLCQDRSAVPAEAGRLEALAEERKLIVGRDVASRFPGTVRWILGASGLTEGDLYGRVLTLLTDGSDIDRQVAEALLTFCRGQAWEEQCKALLQAESWMSETARSSDSLNLERTFDVDILAMLNAMAKRESTFEPRVGAFTVVHVGGGRFAERDAATETPHEWAFVGDGSSCAPGTKGRAGCCTGE